MSSVYRYRTDVTCEECFDELIQMLEDKTATEGSGIESFKANWDEKTVEVTGTISERDLRSLLRRTGSEVTFQGLLQAE